MLNVKKQNTILVLVTVTCSSEMTCHLVGVLLFLFLPFSLSLFIFFFLQTLAHSSTGTIITLKICQDKIEKSSSLHYLHIQLLEITTSKCDLHHLLLIKPLDQIFTKLPQPKLLEENSFYFKEQEGKMKWRLNMNTVIERLQREGSIRRMENRLQEWCCILLLLIKSGLQGLKYTKGPSTLSTTRSLSISLRFYHCIIFLK